MTGQRRQRLELRTIAVSTRAAFRHVHEPEQRDRLKIIADGMLARLAERVRRDGADPALLGEIAAARRDLTERRP